MNRSKAEELEKLYISIFGENEMDDEELACNLARLSSFDPHKPFERFKIYEDTPLRYSNGTESR